MGDEDAKVLDSWEQHDNLAKHVEEQDELQSLLEEETNPQRRCFHNFFIVINVITIASAILMAVGQCLGIFFQHIGPVEYVVRIYVVVLCIVSVLTELEWPEAVKNANILRFFFTRGAIYVFIGILGLEENNATPNLRREDVAMRDTVMNFTLIIALVMIGVGALYMIMGLLCLQIVSTRLRNDFQERLKRARETERITKTYGTKGGGRKGNEV